MSAVEQWKKVQHPNIVMMREAFTSKQFGDHCMCTVLLRFPSHILVSAFPYFHILFSVYSCGFCVRLSPCISHSDGAVFWSRRYRRYCRVCFMVIHYTNHFCTKVNIWDIRRYMYVQCNDRGHVMVNTIIWLNRYSSRYNRAIHGAGLACRVIEPSKILITGKNRLRLNCTGMLDVLAYDAAQNPQSLVPHYQVFCILLQPLF